MLFRSPWFDWYEDQNQAVAGSAALAAMKSVAALGKEKTEVPLPENQTVTPGNVTELGSGRRPRRVREFVD